MNSSDKFIPLLLLILSLSIDQGICKFITDDTQISHTYSANPFIQHNSHQFSLNSQCNQDQYEKLLKEIGMMKMQVYNNSKTLDLLQQSQIYLQTKIHSLSTISQNLQQNLNEMSSTLLNQNIESLLGTYQIKLGVLSELKKQKISKQEQMKTDHLKIVECIQRIRQQRENLFNYELQERLAYTEIQRMENELSVLREKKQGILQKMNTSKIIIEQQLLKKRIYEGKIKQLESGIDQLDKKVIEFQQSSIRTQLQIKKLQKNSRQAQQKQASIARQLTSIHSTLFNLQRQKSVIPSVDILLPNNQQLLTQVQALTYQSNILFNACYLQGTANFINDSFQITNQQLLQYLTDIYSKAVPLPQAHPSISYTFQIIDLFGDQWSSSFGFPFLTQNIIRDTLYLKSDLTCLQNSKSLLVEAGSGIIKQIRRNKISMQSHDNKQLQLILGACTRVESLQIPKPGSLIYYKGFTLSPRILNPTSITIL